MAWVLLRGLGREAGHWGGFPERLRAAFPGELVLTPDLPGCGRRFADRSPARVPELVACARAAAGDIGPGPHWLLGLSLGGLVALEWARQVPDEVAGVVAINSSAGGLSPFWRRLRPAALVALLRAVVTREPGAREARVFRLVSARPERAREAVDAWTGLARAHPVRRRNVARLLWAGARHRVSLRDGAARPTLVLVGAADRMVHPTCSARLAEALGATLAVHPTAGHELSFDEPGWLVTEVARWRSGLTNLSPKRHLVTIR